MKCPFELPVSTNVSVVDSDRRYITGTNGFPFICGDADKDYADYIVQAINSHEKFLSLEAALRIARKYIGRNDCAALAVQNEIEQTLEK